MGTDCLVQNSASGTDCTGTHIELISCVCAQRAIHIIRDHPLHQFKNENFTIYTLFITKAEVTANVQSVNHEDREVFEALACDR